MASNCSQPFCKSCSITSVLAELGPSALVIQPDISGYQTLCFEARRKCRVRFIHTQLTSSYANAPQQLASSPSTVGFITRDFHALISRQYSQTNRRGLHTLFLASKSRCMQKISSVDALLTAQNVLSWSGRFGGGHTGWSQLQLASSVSPLWSK